MDTRKQLIILIVITASLGSFLTGYLLTHPSGQTSGAGQQQGALLSRFTGIKPPEGSAAPDGLFKISADDSLSATNDGSSDGVLYYHRETGFVSRISIADQKSTLVSDVGLPHLIGVIWSPDVKKVLGLYSSASGTLYKYFDYETHKTAELGSDIAAAAFSPDSSSVALAKISGDETDIIVARPDGSDPRTILKTRLRDLSLSWQSDELLSLMAGVSSTASTLYTLGTDGALVKILDSMPDLKIRWSPDATELLYSSTVDDRPGLRIHDMISGTDQAVGVMATADHCSWHLDGRSFVCVAEENASSSIVRVLVSDLSLKTLAADLVFSPDDVFISHLQDFLVLTNRADHSIWAAPLSQ